ncbi:MAG: hypothetical protein IT574_11470 [Candidatus Aureabacteria bacterium]|jgi:hypothetical protein|nr:hypothetical protein [Candidatus Auribacterota bacterium]NLW93735.1 hypothetical protein [Chlamydiota bacterium]HOE26914.1 hypothetical protein [bacterium]HQM51824.1 hypothetical protein [bacterium]
MKMRTMLVLILLILFLWVFHQSGTLERIETRTPSDVPGAPDRVQVEHRLNWGKFNAYVRGFIPRR